MTGVSRIGWVCRSRRGANCGGVFDLRLRRFVLRFLMIAPVDPVAAMAKKVHGDKREGDRYPDPIVLKPFHGPCRRLSQPAAPCGERFKFFGIKALAP